MLSKLLFIISLFSAASVAAQQGAAPVKTTEKPTDPQIDYTHPGAPMPPLRYMPCLSSKTKKNILIEQNSQNEQERKHGQEMSKQMLTNQDLDDGANLFTMIFNPNCSECQEETIMLEQNSVLFKRSKLLLMANPVMISYMSNFIAFARIDSLPPFMYLGLDSSDFIKNVFQYRALPQINIYDKNRKLLKTYSGDVPIDSLKNYIQ